MLAHPVLPALLDPWCPLCTFCLSPLTAVQPFWWSGCVPCVLSTSCYPLSTQPSSTPLPPKALSCCASCCEELLSSRRREAVQTTPCLLQGGGGVRGSRGNCEQELEWRRTVAAAPSLPSPLPLMESLLDMALKGLSSTGAKSPVAAFTTIQYGSGAIFFPSRKEQPLAGSQF